MADIQLKLSELTLQELLAVQAALEGGMMPLVTSPGKAEPIIGKVHTGTPAQEAEPGTPPPPPPATPPIEAVTPPPELDAAGIPWDERIHASTKTKTRNGNWKAKRGVDAGLVARVYAELGTQQDIPGTAVAAAETAPQVTFASVMSKATNGIATGKLQPATVLGIAQSHGLADMTGLVTRGDLVQVVNDELDALLAMADAQ